VRETGGRSFDTFLPAWRDERLGQNVIFDLATFIGAALPKESPTRAVTYMVTQASETASGSYSPEELEMLARAGHI